MPVTIKLKLNTAGLFRMLDEAAPRKMLQATDELRNTVLITLSGTRSGKTYRVPGTKRTYTASAPGQPPAQVTSELRNKIEGKVEGRGMSVIGKVTAKAKHALPLEFGTMNMAARPFMKPSFDKSMDAIKRILTRPWI